MTSREDNATAADVFSRLGAGIQDPVPGGSIREYSGKVRVQTTRNRISFGDVNFFFHFYSILSQTISIGETK